MGRSIKGDAFMPGMRHVVGSLFVAAGVLAIAAFLHFTSFTDAIELPLGLALDLLWIAVGVGLWQRRESARIFASGFFLVGACAVLFAAAYMAGSWRASGELFGLLGGAAAFAAAQIRSLAPSIGMAGALAVLALLLVAQSLASVWLYQYFQRPEVVAQFNAGNGGKPRRMFAYLVATAYAAVIPLYSLSVSLPG
jgi:hypothetical protein